MSKAEADVSWQGTSTDAQNDAYPCQGPRLEGPRLEGRQARSTLVGGITVRSGWPQRANLNFRPAG